MRTLNRDAADVLRPFAPNAVTDVTGFGLLGHAHEMATRSGVRIVLDAARLPALDGALEAARAGRLDRRARATTASTRRVELGDVAPELVELAYDPQTAGGLLVSLPARQGARARGRVRARGPLPRPGRHRRGRRGRRARLSYSERVDAGAQPLAARCAGVALARGAFRRLALANAVHARPDRRDRRDGAPDRLRPRLRALAGLPAAPLRAEELPLATSSSGTASSRS